ncbi:STAS domain-containing protein [Sporosarcina sp. A2]|uniref:STAS domain-containing protein n=1 Tax=Sporosarcina sp. A2 TaxID=3393449 RepID=UPI003D79F013
MESVEIFVEYVKQHKEKLAQEVVDRVCLKFTVAPSEYEKEQALHTYQELWFYLSKSLSQDDLATPDRLLEWSYNNAAMQVKKGERISIIANRYPVTRDVFADVLHEICIELEAPLSVYVVTSKRINSMLDISLNETFFAFEQMTEKGREETERELVKLSAPLVPVQDGIVILPFVGKITDDRVAAIMETILPKIAELHVDTVIADFSGLWSIDEYVARSLQQIENALGLMGIEVFITGLRPELAQTIVNSGSELTSKGYFGTVKQALERLQ